MNVHMHLQFLSKAYITFQSGKPVSVMLKSSQDNGESRIEIIMSIQIRIFDMSLIALKLQYYIPLFQISHN